MSNVPEQVQPAAEHTEHKIDQSVANVGVKQTGEQFDVQGVHEELLNLTRGSIAGSEISSKNLNGNLIPEEIFKDKKNLKTDDSNRWAVVREEHKQQAIEHNLDKVA